MDNEIKTQFNTIETNFTNLEQTNHKILDVLESLQTTVSEMKSEMATKTELAEFKTEVQEQFEFLIENAVTKTELDQAVTKLEEKMATKENLTQAIAPLATKADLLHFTDLFNAKFADLRRDVVQGIRGADKKFLNFAI